MKRKFIDALCLILCLTLMLSVLTACSEKGIRGDLISQKWYSEGPYNVYVLNFKSNGTVIWECYNIETKKQTARYEYRWDVLDNNILSYREDYYDWSDEWIVSDYSLRIGNTEYTHKNPMN